MADDDITSKILTTLRSGSSQINVKKLRKEVLLQLQTDSDDKAAKKKFKKVVQALESDGKISLDSDGQITLIDKEDKKSKKKKKKSKDKEKSDKKSKKEKKRKKTDDDDGNDSDEKDEQIETKKQKVDDNDNDNDNDEGENDDGDESAPVDTDAGATNPDKNKPCPGNPSGYTRLFLGNLPFAVDEASLRTFLSPASMTHVKWITDKETGKFYGSAFVEMETSKCGAIAVRDKNGEKIMGRPIRINFAPALDGDVWPPKSKEMTGNGGQAGGSGVRSMSVKPDNCVKLFVGNLSFDIDDDTIVKFFANVDAEVKAVRWLHHRDSGDFKGCGYVEFWNTEACEKGAALNGKNLMSRPIRIDWTD